VSEPESPAIDEKVLDDLSASVQGDTAFVRELIDAYLADSVAQLDAAEAALAAGDAAGLVRPAHTLKSSSATVGATRLAATARSLEMAARAEELATDEATVAAGALRTEWDAAASALRAWVARDIDR
jgi:two-component system, sensor histidine kinase